MLLPPSNATVTTFAPVRDVMMIGWKRRRDLPWASIIIGFQCLQIYEVTFLYGNICQRFTKHNIVFQSLDRPCLDRQKEPLLSYALVTYYNKTPFVSVKVEFPCPYLVLC